jgi:protease-4
VSLDADQLVDRRRLKRGLTIWRVAAVAAAVAAVAAAVGRFDVLERGKHVARLDVDGLILEDADRDEALGRVAKDDDAKALIVRIDSPGGTFVGGETLYRSLREVAKAKPVVAVMGGTATSAGYMTALGAERIVARAGSVTGSIGVLMQTADVTGLLEKLGVKPESVKSGPLKAQPNPLEPFTAPARAAAEEVVLDLHAMFVEMVEERRKMPKEQALKLADGRVFTGRQAVANGLVDEVGGEAEARRWLADAHKVPLTLPVKDVKISHPGEPWLDLVTTAVRKSLFSERLRLDGVMSVWHPDLR